MGIELEEANIRAKGNSIFFMGLIEFHFNQEPGEEEKKEFQKTVLKMLWPEVLSKT